MTLPVHLTDQAHAELETAYQWWAAHRSQQQASDWYNGLSDAILALEGESERWPLARENDSFWFEVRELHFGLGGRATHRVVYTIRPDIVLVLSIRHVAQADLKPDDV